MTEKEFQQRVIDFADWLGLLVFHDNDSRRNRAGFLDLVLAGSRGVVFAELKAAKGRVTKQQAEWIERLRQSGQQAYLWRPDDWEEVVGCLKAIR